MIREKITQDFNKRKLVCNQEFVKYVEQLDGFDKIQGEFLIAYLSDADLDVVPELLKEHLDHYLRLYKETYVQKIPLEYYFNYVLQPRVNNEKFVGPRQLFYDKVKEYVNPEDLFKTIIDINHWVAAEVHYGRSDARTRNSLLSFKTGKGRCGEKSTFLVDVYRSVGIPARQIYAPWWNHSDDRHAWVEVYYEGEWHYLGAGEGEEIFNKAWFSLAASRAGIVHANHFTNLITKEEVLDDTHGVFKTINRTEMHRQTKPVTINVNIEGVEKVDLCVVNYGELAIMTSLLVKNGVSHVNYGGGDFFVRVIKDNDVYIKYVAEEEHEVTLTLDDKISNLKINQRAGTIKEIPTYKESEASLLERDKKRKHYNELYQKKVEYLETIDINQTQKDILFEALGEDISKKILAQLSEKDQEDFDAEILISHYNNVKEYSDNYSEDVFYQYLSHPRLYVEELTDYSEAYKKIKADVETLAEKALLIDETIETRVQAPSEFAIPDTIIPINRMLDYGHGNQIEKELLKVAIARSNGIASRFNENTKVAEYYDQGEFHVFNPDNAYHTITITSNDENAVVSIKNISADRSFMLENQPEMTAAVPNGIYEILMSKRMPNGTVLADYHVIHVNDDQHTIHLEIDAVNIEDMVDNIFVKDLIDEIDLDLANDAILVIGESTKEPTHHILNEMMDCSEDINQRNLPIYFFEHDAQSNTEMINACKDKLNNFKVMKAFDKELENRLIRRVFCEPGVYPLFLVYTDGHARLSNSGYQVGLIDNSWFLDLLDF